MQDRLHTEYSAQSTPYLIYKSVKPEIFNSVIILHTAFRQYYLLLQGQKRYRCQLHQIDPGEVITCQDTGSASNLPERRQGQEQKTRD